MLPELFRIPIIDKPIYSYGLMMVIAFLAVMQISQRLARHKGLNPELFMNAALIALVSGIMGARLSHILENINDFTRPNLSVWQNFFNMINISSGGLTYYGGFLLATPVLIGYALWKKVPLRLGMDIVAICVPIGLGFGRIGCFLNGCCYGAECHLPWAVRFPVLAHAEPSILYPVHPAQLYSTITAFLIAGILWSYFTLSPRPGKVFALMLMLEGSTRYILEMLRVEPPVWGPMSLSMIIGAGMALAGVILWFAWRGTESQSVDSTFNKVRAGSPGH